MNHKTLPGTDLDVSFICLGTSEFGSTIDEGRSFRLLDTFVERGGNFLDTANVYANWIPGERSLSEKTLGRWMRSRKNRDRIVVATKGAHPRLASMQVPRLSPGEIVEDLEDSLRNLQVDTIDLYYLHRDDPTRAVAEIVDTLHAQQASGKIRYFACSNWRADRIREAQAYADAQGFQGFVADQMLWNLAVVDPEALVGQGVVTMDKELRRLHAETGMAAVPFSSQAGGLFQKMSAGTLDGRNPALTRTYPTLQNRQRFERIQHLALESGLTVSQIVLGYLLSQPFVTLPIVGCKSLPHLHDSLSAADVVLTPSQIAYLERGEVHEGGVGSS